MLKGDLTPGEWALLEPLLGDEYVSFGADTVCLDGDFTAAQLQAITNVLRRRKAEQLLQRMESQGAPGPVGPQCTMPIPPELFDPNV